MKKLALLLLVVAALAATPAFADTYVYVGSFHVYDGQVWTSNPNVMSARDVAAMLYGGVKWNYAISINPNTVDQSTITFTAHEDGWGNTQYLGAGSVGQDYSLSSIGGGYNNYPSFSAYVCDHAACAAYGYPVNGAGGAYPFSEQDYTNYVWRDISNPVPEPGSLVLLGSGLFGLAGTLRRRFLS